jgi:uncharacterized protein
VKRGFFLTILLMVLLFLAGGASASEVPVRLNLYSEGGVLSKRVKSMKELRLSNMVPQSRDFSCGAAALATVLRYYYGQPVSELDAILGMFKHGDQQDIRKRGFSLFDMKRFANSIQYKADGFKIPKLELLKTFQIPVIVLIDTRSYKHFVVLRRVDDKYAYISDPSWGNRKMPLKEFAEAWDQNIVFAIQGPKVGTPEGMYVETPQEASEVSQMLVREGRRPYRFAMDPADAMIFISATHPCS